MMGEEKASNTVLKFVEMRNFRGFLHKPIIVI